MRDQPAPTDVISSPRVRPLWLWFSSSTPYALCRFRLGHVAKPHSVHDTAPVGLNRTSFADYGVTPAPAAGGDWSRLLGRCVATDVSSGRATPDCSAGRPPRIPDATHAGVRRLGRTARPSLTTGMQCRAPNQEAKSGASRPRPRGSDCLTSVVESRELNANYTQNRKQRQ
jgi:hypothetical protein